MVDFGRDRRKGLALTEKQATMSMVAGLPPAPKSLRSLLVTLAALEAARTGSRCAQSLLGRQRVAATAWQLSIDAAKHSATRLLFSHCPHAL